jgi:hypothetical protein
MRAIIIILAAVLVQGADPLVADMLTCSQWQSFTTCSSPSGATSTEWSRDGMRFGQDSDGNRWTTSRWRDVRRTTVEPPGR